MNGLDLLLVVLVVILAFLGAHLLNDARRRAAELDERLRDWLAGKGPR